MIASASAPLAAFPVRDLRLGLFLLLCIFFVMMVTLVMVVMMMMVMAAATLAEEHRPNQYAGRDQKQRTHYQKPLKSRGVRTFQGLFDIG
jgi:hypothetical protein